ncbi:MAG: hypothetical protein Q9207_006584 [Kuettlingeria erythrocarpa]
MNLNQPFENILQNRQKSTSYELPHHVAAYETKIRSFRSRLPESEYTQDDKKHFHEEFTDLIEECHIAIPAAQNFHTHIVGTIKHHVSDTKYIVKRLEDEGFLSSVPMPMPTDGLLVQNIIWLGTRRLLYLPAGIKPLLETSVQAHRMRGVSLMEDHVADMKRRIEKDIGLTLELQASLTRIGHSSEKIAAHISIYKQSNTADAYNRGSQPFLRMREMVVGQGYEGYQIEQRSRWLETMGPVFDDSVTFVNLAVHELGAAYHSCQSLMDRLSYEGRAAKYDTDAPEWIKEQAKELEVGIEDLEAQLKGFKLEQLRFSHQIFRSGSSQHE